MGETDKPNQPPTPAAPEPEPITLAEFLENVPPSQAVKIANLFSAKRYSSGTPYNELNAPELQLHCPRDTCNGLRFFRLSAGDRTFPREGDRLSTFIYYVCSNCLR